MAGPQSCAWLLWGWGWAEDSGKKPRIHRAAEQIVPWVYLHLHREDLEGQESGGEDREYVSVVVKG